MNNLLQNVEFVVVEASAAAGQTELTTDVIDMAGWHGVAFVAHLGDVTTGSVLGFVADHSDADDGGWDDLAGALSFTAGATDADGKLMVLELIRPEKRFVRARLQRGVANAILGGIVAIKFGPTFAPVTQGASVLASTTLANPLAA